MNIINSSIFDLSDLYESHARLDTQWHYILKVLNHENDNEIKDSKILFIHEREYLEDIITNKLNGIIESAESNAEFKKCLFRLVEALSIKKISKANGITNESIGMETDKKMKLENEMKVDNKKKIENEMEMNKEIILENEMKTNKEIELENEMKTNKEIELENEMKINKEIELENEMKINKEIELENEMEKNEEIKVVEINKEMKMENEMKTELELGKEKEKARIDTELEEMKIMENHSITKLDSKNNTTFEHLETKKVNNEVNSKNLKKQKQNQSQNHIQIQTPPDSPLFPKVFCKEPSNSQKQYKDKQDYDNAIAILRNKITYEEILNKRQSLIDANEIIITMETVHGSTDLSDIQSLSEENIPITMNTTTLVDENETLIIPVTLQEDNYTTNINNNINNNNNICCSYTYNNEHNSNHCFSTNNNYNDNHLDINQNSIDFNTIDDKPIENDSINHEDNNDINNKSSRGNNNNNDSKNSCYNNDNTNSKSNNNTISIDTNSDGISRGINQIRKENTPITNDTNKNSEIITRNLKEIKHIEKIRRRFSTIITKQENRNRIRQKMKMEGNEDENEKSIDSMDSYWDRKLAYGSFMDIENEENEILSRRERHRLRSKSVILSTSTATNSMVSTSLPSRSLSKKLSSSLLLQKGGIHIEKAQTQSSMLSPKIYSIFSKQANTAITTTVTATAKAAAAAVAATSTAVPATTSTSTSTSTSMLTSASILPLPKVKVNTRDCECQTDSYKVSIRGEEYKIPPGYYGHYAVVPLWTIWVIGYYYKKKIRPKSLWNFLSMRTPSLLAKSRKSSNYNYNSTTSTASSISVSISNSV